MKILFTVATYYPHKDGVQNVTEYEAEGLAALGHQVTLITSDNNGDYTSEEFHNGVRIRRINAFNKNMFHYGNKNLFQKMVLEEATKSDLMINVCLQSFAADWILPVIDQIHCKKILIMHGMHNFNWSGIDFTSVKSFAFKLLRNIRWSIFYKKNWENICKYDSVIHLHEKDYAYIFFQRHGYYHNYVLYNAVDNKLFIADCNDKENIVLNIGTFVFGKNQKTVLKSFYCATTNNYKLVLIGNPDNEYYHSLLKYREELEKKYGHKEVNIYCNLDRDKTVEFIRKAKIYMCTSRWEVFPISIAEAMAAHMAFISTDVGIVRYLPGGIVCDDVGDMPEKLTELIEGDISGYADISFAFARNNLTVKSQVDKLNNIIKTV